VWGGIEEAGCAIGSEWGAWTGWSGDRGNNCRYCVLRRDVGRNRGSRVRYRERVGCVDGLGAGVEEKSAAIVRGDGTWGGIEEAGCAIGSEWGAWTSWEQR